MKSLKLAILNIKMNLKNEKALKSSFIISVFGMALNNIAILLLWYYFGKAAGEINGWKPMDIYGLNGFGCISYGLIVSFFYGIYEIPNYITTANLDKYLLTPKNILIKIATSRVETSALGDILFGVICLTIYAVWSKMTIFHILISIPIIIMASIIMFSFSLICMSISFYLMDGYNVSHGLFGMFLSNMTYHGGAFTGILKIIFIFVIPSLLLGAIPVEMVKSISVNSLLMLMFLTIFWFNFSIMFFYKSLKKYDSNNLFGFGN